MRLSRMGSQTAAASALPGASPRWRKPAEYVENGYFLLPFFFAFEASR